jgi:hypothetical protein
MYLAQGDVAIVTDEEGLSKTWLLDACRLFETCAALNDLVKDSAPVSSEIKHVFILSAADDSTKEMPVVALPDGLQSSETLRRGNHKTYDAAVRDATTVKSEASGHAEEKSSIDWTKAYEVFFLCVVKRGGIDIRKDPSDA